MIRHRDEDGTHRYSTDGTQQFNHEDGHVYRAQRNGYRCQFGFVVWDSMDIGLQD